MTAEQVASALIGAFFGAFGWLLVGLYMQRRLHDRQARNAARAVYFELAVNRIDVDVALRVASSGHSAARRSSASCPSSRPGFGPRSWRPWRAPT